VADDLLATLGLYGAALGIGFAAGMFPLISIEAFLFGVARWADVDVPALVALIGLGAAGHQAAKTVTYYAGAGAFELPRGKTRARIEAAQRWIDRWNKRPRLVLFASAAIGLPPLYALGFIARPVMHLSIAAFTAISLAGRLGRFVVLVAAARLI
jgi:membrane protein YqaA with SNARE-associated domain